MNRVAEDRAEFAARLALLATHGISSRGALALIREAGNGLAALRLVRSERGEAAWKSLISTTVRERVRRVLHALAGSDIVVICHDDADYPQILADRLGDEMPPVLFTRGNPGVLDVVCAGIVGSRAASVYGQDVARQLGFAVAVGGGCVVSGMARGIDAAAHEGALEAGGATVAVLGSGVDVVYPVENDKLYHHIAETGLLISEQLPGESPRRFTFTYRNRIIAALSNAVVVVEAARRSGALATANHAARFGVDVYGVPNALHAPGVQGVLTLFRDGAHVYTGAQDFLEAIGIIQLGERLPSVSDDDAPVVRVSDEVPLGADGSLVVRLSRLLHVKDAVHVDELAQRAGATAEAVLAGLLELELDGVAVQHAGLRFSRAYDNIRRPPG